jgi:hypothetical protein
VTVERRVGLLERRSHGRKRFTQALKDHFGSRAAAAVRAQRVMAR